MYGSLHELNIRSLLELLEREQATGQLLIQSVPSLSSAHSLQPSFWLLSLSRGQITYTINKNYLLYQRLQDYLRRYQVEAAMERLPSLENIPLPSNLVSATGRSLPEYNYLWGLLEHHVLTADQGKQILEHIVHETLFDLLSLQEGSFIFQDNIVFEPQLNTIEITPLLHQVMGQLQQWKQLYPYISSPEESPLLIKNQELQQALTPSAYRSLAVACQGELTLRRIARYLNKDLLTISQALYPYVQRGWLQMLPPETGDEPGISSATSSTPPVSTVKIAYIGQETPVRNEIVALLTQEGYPPLLIADPIEALSEIARSQPSLVFLALDLFPWSAEQLTESLKHIPPLKTTPIILVTSETPDPLRLLKSQLLGITEILVPPVNESQLRLLLKTYIPSANDHRL